MDTSRPIFLHTMRYKFVIIMCLRIFGSVKRGDRTNGAFPTSFQPQITAYT